LIWRDFYFQLGVGFPKVLHGEPLKEKYINIKWENDIKKFNLWKSGNTGYPIVDAGMKQLNATGFMHNRARLITASFLVKNLFIDWRWGEKYYASKLYDYDPLVNNGNWQWVSSTGADSQPYFRMFNPWLQSKKHDPDGSYIKKWIPGLIDVDPKIIHHWYKYSKLREYSNMYIKPIVDYHKTKKIVLETYKTVAKV
jgi:deoxyribodipyrimidine photo-lyase